MFWIGAVSPSYFRVMNVPVLTGRAFTEADTQDAEPVVLVSASTAHRFWPAGDAIGKHLKHAGENRWRRIVGIVADVHQFNLADRPPASISGATYMPYAQSVDGQDHIPRVMHLLVRTGSVAPQAAEDLRRLAMAQNPNIPVGRVIELDRMRGESLADFRSTTWLFLSFTGVALALAAIGIYGLVSYSASQRTYEIALRMAIGATAPAILRLILLRSLRICAAGLAVGIAAALVITQLLPAIWPDVREPGLAVCVLAGGLLALVSLVASALPAWQASQTDPVRILRAE